MLSPETRKRLVAELSYEPSGSMTHPDGWRYDWHISEEGVVVTYSESYFTKEGQDEVGCYRYEKKEQFRIPVWIFEALFKRIQRDISWYHIAQSTEGES